MVIYNNNNNNDNINFIFFVVVSREVWLRDFIAVRYEEERFMALTYENILYLCII